ncbi:MAG: hypothetical protein DRN91_06930 [Candidatus Alkanophagales archaeon]|nr:MAG: hypothetical protein DRN91_06930 [Candidatus Alkanophagales archaeon]
MYMHFGDIDGDGFEEAFGVRKGGGGIATAYVVDHDGSLITTIPVVLSMFSLYFATVGSKLYIADANNLEFACYDLLTGSKLFSSPLPGMGMIDGVVYAPNLGKIVGFEEGYWRCRNKDTGAVELERRPTYSGLFTLCDIDGDGVEELFMIDDSGYISIWDIAEDSEIIANVTGIGVFPFRIHSADVDNDGKFEILYHSRIAGKIIVIDDDTTVLTELSECLGAVCDVDLDEYAELITVSGSLLRAYRG